MKKSVSKVLVGAALVASAAVVQSLAWAQDAAEAPKPKHTIHDVMEQAHGGGLLNKVAAGEASAEEKALLLDLYISLAENEPERGEAASYHKFAGQALMAVAKVAAGREGAEGQLKANVDCMGCHRAHRPPQER